MNASDADRPESNENVPEPPVPSEPGGEAGNTVSSNTPSSNRPSGAKASRGTDAEDDETDVVAEGRTGARVPDPIRPAEGQSVDDPSVTFEWERVEAADNYQLQIAKDRDFVELVFDARVGSSSAFTYSGLPPQEGFTLYWRVRAHSSEDGSWTDFGTVGTFVLADWRPEQPALAQAQEASAPVADADIGDSSRTEPVLITFAIAVTVIAVGLSIVYMQDGGFASTAEEPEVAETANADSVSLDLEEPVPNEDGETYRISINDAMRQVVRERGGTWEGPGGDGAPRENPPNLTEQEGGTPGGPAQGESTPVQDTPQQEVTPQEEAPTSANDTP